MAGDDAVQGSDNLAFNSNDRASERDRRRQSSRSESRSSRLRGPEVCRRDSSRHGRRCAFKQQERNFPAAVLAMFVIVILSTALAEPRWFYMRGGGCRNSDLKDQHYLGAYQFFYYSTPYKHVDNAKHQSVYMYHSGPLADDVLIDCVNDPILKLMRSMVALCFVGILFSMCAFLLDLTGPSARVLKGLRRNAFFSIVTVIVCISIVGFSYWTMSFIAAQQTATRLNRGSKIVVEFSVSFYLVAAAGGLAVVCAASNLLKRPAWMTSSSHRSRDQRPIIDALDDPELDLQRDLYAQMAVMPPPPPYTP